MSETWQDIAKRLDGHARFVRLEAMLFTSDIGETRFEEGDSQTVNFGTLDLEDPATVGVLLLGVLVKIESGSYLSEEKHSDGRDWWCGNDMGRFVGHKVPGAAVALAILEVFGE